MEWTRGPVIGRGSTATVHLATTTTGHHFSVKSTELSTSTFLQKEQQILSQFNSPNIISYMGYDTTYYNNKSMYNLFMEYAPFGTISDMIKKHNGSLDESLIRSYIKQILMGLDHIHLNNIVHRDIKCDNLLLCDNGVKIGDMGCAKRIEMLETKLDYSEVKSFEFSGTPVFMAPEVARGEEQKFAADVWAVGCVVIEMATGKNPWPEVNDPVAALYKIGYSGEIPEFPWWVSPECKDFLEKCLNLEVEKRWTVKQLLEHPFVDNLNLGFKKVEEFTKNSPTCVLDQDIWGCLENSPEITQVVEFSGKSPAERIMQLSKGTSCLPNWFDEEDWIIVRSNHVDESLKLFEYMVSMDLDESSESTRVESASDLCFEFRLEKGAVKGDNVNVIRDFPSQFLDFEKILDDNNLFLASILYICNIFVNCIVILVMTMTMSYPFHNQISSLEPNKNKNDFQESKK
ncbi:mitogen-activated protein kinase kinase kinase 18 [Rutidosis leptorrhynchoides]|uniref:mitogen-activated protein kinase kinase kinase 18 n=1 Tax=Rutidosis leptorrhynchoides TaxID=125765 RepID=UPI003A98E991